MEDQLTPENLGIIAGMAVLCLVATIAWQAREDVFQLLSAFKRRYFAGSFRELLAGIADNNMSSEKDVPENGANEREQRSYAVERDRELLGTGGMEPVPNIREHLEHLSDDDLLDVLSCLRTASGEYRFADSRVAKFIGGRIEDRLLQVRDVRGKEAPPKLAAVRPGYEPYQDGGKPPQLPREVLGLK